MSPSYMDFMILYKWVTPLATPPSLINSLISMAMRQPDPAPLWDGALELETYLIAAAALSVPWLLFPKIIYLWSTQPPPKHDHKEATLPGGAGGAAVVVEEEEAHPEFAEEVIEQIIFTIEFVGRLLLCVDKLPHDVVCSPT